MDPKDEVPGTPAAPAAPAPVVPEVDDFAAAFADLNKDPVPATPAAEKPAAGEPTPAAAPAQATAPATPEAAPGGTETSAASATPASTPTTPPADFVSRADFEALQQQLAEMRQATPAPATPMAPEAPAPAATPLYTDDEQAAIGKYLDEWPDVARGEALQRRAEYQQLTGYIFGEVQKALAPLVEMAARVPALSEDTQYRTLTEMIPDYDDARDPCIEWVAKQPAYLKAAYEKVTSEGSPEDIADLVARFKKETGWVAPASATPAAAPAPAATPAAAPAAAAPTAAPAANPTAPAIPAAAAAAAASLKPVKGGRTMPAASADPNDFDGAWAEFATGTR